MTLNGEKKTKTKIQQIPILESSGHFGFDFFMIRFICESHHLVVRLLLGKETGMRSDNGESNE